MPGEELILSESEPTTDEVQSEVTASWPGVVQVETRLGDMQLLLGKERYHAQIELQRSFGTMRNTRARMVGNVGTRGAVPGM